MVAEVLDWLEGTDIQATLREMATAENQLESAKQALSVLKKKLALTLKA